MRKLSALVGAGVIALAGCGKSDGPYIETNVPKYYGYDVIVNNEQIMIGNLINDDPAEGFKEVLYARLDTIGIPIDGISFKGEDGKVLGDLAEKFANPDILFKIYNEVKAGARD